LPAHLLLIRHLQNLIHWIKAHIKMVLWSLHFLRQLNIVAIRQHRRRKWWSREAKN
jgi:hypothetical protein